MDKEEEDTKAPEIAEAANPHNLHHVREKDESDRDGTKQIQVCQIVRSFADVLCSRFGTHDVFNLRTILSARSCDLRMCGHGSDHYSGFSLFPEP